MSAEERTMPDWTFNPPDPYDYLDEDYYCDLLEGSAPRVLLLGTEPNGTVNGPEDRDMGTWMRDAHDHQFWNPGGRKFFRAQLLHASIALAALGEDVENRDWYTAGTDGLEHRARELMARVRVADLKAEAGGHAADMAKVEQWALDHLDAVHALFDPVPDVVVLQGRHVQQIVARHWERLLPEQVRETALIFGLPHPSARSGYPVAALQKLVGKRKAASATFRNQLRKELHRWSAANGWVSVRADRQAAPNEARQQPAAEPGGSPLYEQNLATLEVALQRLDQNLTLHHKGQWTAVKRTGEQGANRLMLRYDGTIGLNLEPSAEPAALPFGCEVASVQSDYRAADFHRHTFSPGNADDAEAWSRLFVEVLRAQVHGRNYPSYRGILSQDQLDQPRRSTGEWLTFSVDDDTSVRMRCIDTSEGAMVGNQTGRGRENEFPCHPVVLSHNFAMAEFPVTQQLYRSITGTNPSRFSDAADADRRPVEKVSWFDAVAFCNALSGRLGLEPAYQIDDSDVQCDFSASGFRLPTEHEWELAARADDGFRYAGGDNIDQVGWVLARRSRDTKQSHAVGLKLSNGWGLFDMSGNVAEWCFDRYAEDAYEEFMVDPTGPESGDTRVVRGGCWDQRESHARVCARQSVGPEAPEDIIGFRIVRTIQ
jgi:formylglycine-generating enzyme required for sulfatase activity